MIDYRIGDVFARLAEIPDGTVSLIATSPPFIRLRSYLPDDHPDKAKEIGAEPDPATFIDTLLALTAEWGRVLAPWGSIAIELGDTYTGAGGYGSPDSPNPAYGKASFEARFEGRAAKRFKRKDDGWPLAKSLALIPQLYAASLAYGRNLLTGEESPAGQWMVRNVIVWHRPNPAVGQLRDKFRPATSYIVVATRDRARWFDMTAVRREPAHGFTSTRAARKITPTPGMPDRKTNQLNEDGLRVESNAAGAPPLDAWFDEHDTWTVTASGSPLAHYAMWPPKLAERLVLSMCPADVCSICGEPRRRIEHNEYSINRLGGTTGQKRSIKEPDGRVNGKGMTSKPTMSAHPQTLGWTDCGCDYVEALRTGVTPAAPQKWMPGVVLDPFAGTGTTLCVADMHGRDSIGIDIDGRNERLVNARYAECKRSLFGTTPELPGQEQLDMFGAS